MVLSHACQKTTFPEAMRLDVSMSILTIPVMVSWCDGNTRKTPAAQKVWDTKSLFLLSLKQSVYTNVSTAFCFLLGEHNCLPYPASSRICKVSHRFPLEMLAVLRALTWKGQPFLQGHPMKFIDKHSTGVLMLVPASSTTQISTPGVASDKDSLAKTYQEPMELTTVTRTATTGMICYHKNIGRNCISLFKGPSFLFIYLTVKTGIP